MNGSDVSDKRISVVMSCYAGDKLEYLQESVTSILKQSITFFEFIIVIDGPVSDSIKYYLHQLSVQDSRINIIELPVNMGISFARNCGMEKATGDFIAIMDADDISVPCRFEVQLKSITELKVDAVWGWQREFYEGSGAFAGIKKSAEHHSDIVRELKFRNLLPDPTTFVRRECFRRTGGYGNLKNINMDYQFFVMMALEGFKLYCIPEVLIHVRVSPDQRKRRGGIRLLLQDIRLRNWMRNKGFINGAEYVKAVTAIGIFRLIPNYIRDLLYRYVLRHGD